MVSYISISSSKFHHKKLTFIESNNGIIGFFPNSLHFFFLTGSKFTTLSKCYCVKCYRNCLNECQAHCFSPSLQWALLWSFNVFLGASIIWDVDILLIFMNHDKVLRLGWCVDQRMGMSANKYMHPSACRAWCNQRCLGLVVKIEVLWMIGHRFESPLPFFVLCTAFVAHMDQKKM